jgi:hypothetical protein
MNGMFVSSIRALFSLLIVALTLDSGTALMLLMAVGSGSCPRVDKSGLSVPIEQHNICFVASQSFFIV